MAQPQTISVGKKIQSSTDDFYKFFQQTSNLLHQVCADIVQKIDLVDGTSSWFFNDGSRVRIYIRLSPDKSENIKYEVADVKGKKITFNVLEGALLATYNFFKLTLEVTPASIAKWTIDYQKNFPSSPDPYEYLDLCSPVTDLVDKHLASHGSA